MTFVVIPTGSVQRSGCDLFGDMGFLSTSLSWYKSVVIWRRQNLTDTGKKKKKKRKPEISKRVTGGSDDKEWACSVGDLGSVPGLGRSPGEGNGNPLRYSCLENPMDRGACQEPVNPLSMGLWRVRHDWETFIFRGQRRRTKLCFKTILIVFQVGSMLGSSCPK